jgi:membrane protein YqaA with SNARE-associated domain
MNAIVNHLFEVFIQLGPFGLLILGILDSSFLLFLPLGNDLLMVALTARKHRMLPVFAVMAAAGSVLGCLLTDWVARKGGEKGLGKIIGRRLNYVTRKVKDRAGKALVFASLMPPPFPFTAFVAGAAAFQYPRKRLLAMIAVARFARFFVLGALAIVFGERIIRLAKTPGVRIAILAVAVISVVGSVVSVVSWIKRNRQARA